MVSHVVYVAECTCGAWDVARERAFRVHERSKRPLRDGCLVTVREVRIPAPPPGWEDDQIRKTTHK